MAMGKPGQLTTGARQPDGTVGESSTAARATIDQRRSARRSLTVSAQSTSADAGSFTVLIRSISQDGVLIDAGTTPLSLDDVLHLDLPQRGAVEARVVWKNGTFFGCHFGQSVGPGVISAALLKADPQVHQPVVDPGSAVSGELAGVGPQLNFLAAFLLALAAWAIIGSILYLVVY